ncbi:DUF418 domain-containing protein [Bacillus cereus]|uniref:DUF418 domain-containing protein n=1 Tax=Bacillus cereus TaxID=1396 RepID=UPI000C290710|nr:DUF418 domain-containing protein [Bacillus cereus]
MKFSSTEISDRIELLDYLRGFTLLGIMFVYINNMGTDLPIKNINDQMYQQFLYLFIEARFVNIFAFLFGIGFYGFITRANSKGQNGYLLFLRRIIGLFIFGLLLRFFISGEPLTFYAICGLILLPFYKVRKEINFIISIVILVALSCIVPDKFLLILPLTLLGITAGQYHIFEPISKKKKGIAIFSLIILLCSSFILLFYQYTQMPTTPFIPMFMEVADPVQLQTNKFLSIGVIIGPIVSAFFVASFTLLFRLAFIKKLLLPFKYCGRMSLTNFFLQPILFLIVFYSLNNISLFQSLFVCLGLYALQATFSIIWLNYFRMGPLEWGLRFITYFKVS